MEKFKTRLAIFFKNIEYLTKYSVKDLALREAWLRNLPYEILDKSQTGQIQLPRISNRFETLSKIIEDRCSLSRFGDGELNLTKNISIPFQTASLELATLLQDILKSEDERIMICLPDTFGSLDQYTGLVQTFSRTFMAQHRSDFYQLIDFEKQYYDASVSRPYMILADKSNCGNFYAEFKKVWDNRDVVIIEGAKTKMGIGNDLLDNTKSIKRILAPEINAFNQYGNILAAASEQPKDVLFLLCLGPTATVLAYDLAIAGFQAIDSGHLDIEYEWFLRKSQSRIKIEGKYVLEASDGTSVSNVTNEQYEKEIIASLVD